MQLNYFVYFCNMISKSQLKNICLYKQQKQCDADNVFVVEGVKMCAEAMASRQCIVAVAALPEWLQQHYNQLKAVASLHEEKVFELAPADLDRLSGQKSPNQVWMLLRRPVGDTAEAGGNNVEDGDLTLVLDHLQDPGNLGTIIRTADWFGIRHIYCSNDTVNCYNPKVVQASMGGIFRTRVDYRPLVPLMQHMRDRGCEIYGALLDGENVYRMPLGGQGNKASNAPGITRKVLVMGNESRGIGAEVAAMVTHRVRIPNLGGTCESLNAGVAAAVLISELMRDKSVEQQ